MGADTGNPYPPESGNRMTVQRARRDAPRSPEKKGVVGMRQEARGLTLIELVVTLAVASVLLGIGVPSFQKLQRGMRADTTFHLLTTALATARISAVSRRVPVSVCPSLDGERCHGTTAWEHGWIVFADPGRQTQPPSVDSILHRFDALRGGMALHSTAGRTLIRFHPSGMASGSNLSIRLCTTREQRHLGSVIVNNAGRARTERYENAACPFVP